MLDGRLYICGGLDGWEFRRSVERFDPGSGMWELLPPMRGRRASAGAACLWACGGSEMHPMAFEQLPVSPPSGAHGPAMSLSRGATAGGAVPSANATFDAEAAGYLPADMLGTPQ